MKRLIRDERGVALITVLFVAAALTVVGTTASYVAIGEIRAGGRDRRGGQAFSYSEAGVERMVAAVRQSSWTWNEMMHSGCDGTPPKMIKGRVGDPSLAEPVGSFLVTLRPLEPVPCAVAVGPPSTPQKFAITSTSLNSDTPPAAPADEACQPAPEDTAAISRTVCQIVRVSFSGLPIGVYTRQGVDANGVAAAAKMRRISLVTEGNITGRDKIAFTDRDPWYTPAQFYGDGFPDTTNTLPAAAHAGGIIDCKANAPCGTTKIEHDTADDFPLNCTANSAGTLPAQAAWDGSINGGPINTTCVGSPVGAAPTSKFTPEQARALGRGRLTAEEHLNLQTAALTSGLYCNRDTCRFAGGPAVAYPGTISAAFVTTGFGGQVPRNLTAYFDFPATTNPESTAHTVNWAYEVDPCSFDPNLNKSLVLVARNGSISIGGNIRLTGAMFAEDGKVEASGTSRFNGSLIANRLVLKGNPEFILDECAIANLMNPFLDVASVRWSEIDR